ncbi:hypothetical protein ACT29H_01045 [Thermophagus sp. OGC60D27]|uniref:hypothetical protein n=1 Tax=Thermophagus sp. OGC60D27 TaxID=3458415 RepID=UPI004037DE3E
MNKINDISIIVLLLMMTMAFSSCKDDDIKSGPEPGGETPGSVDLTPYKERKAWLIDAFKDDMLTKSGKHGIPFALIRLENDPNDEKALNYLTYVADGYADMFYWPGLALALHRYWDNFSDAQKSHLQSKLEQYGSSFLGHGTENHASMLWCGGYLLAQLFPDANWSNGQTSEQLMATLKNNLSTTFKNVYAKGNAESLSTTYEQVYNFPIEILYECAEDADVKKMAEAMLLYKWALISLLQFEGTTIAPYARMNTQQDHAPTYYYVAGTTYYNWLLFGWGSASDNVKLEQFTKNYSDASETLYTVVSEVEIPEVFFRIGMDKSPMTIKSSMPTFGSYGSGVPHAVMRKAYRAENFAIGTGNFRWVPGGDLMFATNGFNICWSSADRFNYIGCFAPYFFTKGSGPDTWDLGNISPFQQTAHHEGSVITLFDIPQEDPWPNVQNPISGEDFWGWRSAYADDLVKVGMVRYPKTMDEEIEKEGWIFLREGEVYIGIKPLKDYTIDKTSPDASLDGFNVIKSSFAKTGFVFEVSDSETSGSFADFQTKVLSNSLSVDWGEMTCEYTNINGDNLYIKFQEGFPLVSVANPPSTWQSYGITGMHEAVPTVEVNGVADESYSEWPLLDSPYVTMDDGILNINDGTTSIRVIWKGSLPIISK